MDERIKNLIDQADAIVIGAGAGLSTAAGINYGGERFQRLFPDFIEKYHLTDMYSTAFYPFETPEERWAYWSKHIYHNYFEPKAGQVYKNLLNLVKDKDYFVLTTNADGQFFKAGFKSKRVFACQGDYGKIQCSKPCHNQLYDVEATVMAMIKTQKNFKVPSELIPMCPICGEPMESNLRKDDTFVEDEDWDVGQERYQAFIDKYQNKKIVFMELGVGMNTPGIIKYPFIRMTHQFPDASYICLNQGQAYLPKVIEDRSLSINDDIATIMA